jgi:hypothetical protein
MWKLWHRTKPMTDQVANDLSDELISHASLPAVYDIRVEITSRHLKTLCSNKRIPRPGETFAGNVTLSVIRPAFMNDITVELSGRCSVFIGTTSGLPSDNGGENVDLFKPRQHVLSAVPCELQPEQSYQWPFSMVLPTTTEYALRSDIDNTDHPKALRPVLGGFKDGQHPLPSSFHFSTRDGTAGKNLIPPKTTIECKVLYTLSVKINRKYMPDHYIFEFPFHLMAHNRSQVPAQVYRKRLSTLENPISSRCDGTHQILRRSEVHMDVLLPVHACMPICIAMSVQPGNSMKPKPEMLPPILMSVQLQLRKCLRMRYNSGSKEGCPSKRKVYTFTSVIATHFIPCYGVLGEQPHKLDTALISFAALTKDTVQGSSYSTSDHTGG